MGDSHDLQPLVDALARQEDLAKRVGRLRTSNRVLAVVVVALVTAFGVETWNSVRLSHLIQEVEEDRILGDLAACRTRNHGFQVNREGWLNFYSKALVLNPDSAEQILELRRRHPPTAKDTDSDCNGDGVLGSEDYPVD